MEELTTMGYPVSSTTVGDLLNEMGFSLQSNKKTIEGGNHPDRNEQFEYINAKVMIFQDCGLPVIYVDTKKKELVGNYKNNGSEYDPEGDPVKVDDHDFEDKKLGKALPYGVYDITNNTGFVNVGTNYDTAEFAVSSIRGWWINMGKVLYPQTGKLLINVDGGGSNGS